MEWKTCWKTEFFTKLPVHKFYAAFVQLAQIRNHYVFADLDSTSNMLITTMTSYYPPTLPLTIDMFNA